MAKRKVMNQLSKRFSRHKSNDSIGSLNPDTNVIDEEQLFWWHHLEENTQHSMTYNDTNETTKQLNVDSKLDSIQGDTVEWWKNLSGSNSKHNVSVGSKKNFSAAVVETNILEKSSSESDEEINIKKKKLRLKSTSRMSENNAFLNVLNNTEPDVSLRSPQMKGTISSNLYNFVSDKVSEKIYRNKEDSLNLSSTANVLKLRPSIFKKKKNRWMKKQDILTENISTENITLDDNGKELALGRSNTASPLNLPTSKTQKKITSDNNKTIQKSEESDVSREILKPKSRLMKIYAKKSMEINAFESAVINNRDLNLPKYNPEINIHDANFLRSSPNYLINSSRVFGNKSINEISVAHKNVIPKNTAIRRSPRLSLNVFKKQSLNSSIQIQNNERNVSNFSSNSYEALKTNPVILKPKSKEQFFIHLNKNLSKNQTKFDEDDVNLERNNAAVLTKDNYISIKQNKPTARISQIDGSLSIARDSQLSLSQLNDQNLMPLQVSLFADAEKMNKIKNELERIKHRERATMKVNIINNKKSISRTKSVSNVFKKARKAELLVNRTKIVDKAFIMNGKIYKVPKLPRPKHWATDRLYKFLWKCMEPKYKLATRVQSEKFIEELAKIVTLIERRKKYNNYKIELESLIKKMARLEIINTRSDFYNFCQNFLPYEFRVKVIPMLLPGNKRIIPYDPNELHTPLLDI